MKKSINPVVLMQVGLNLLTVLIVVSLLYFTGALASPASTLAVPGFLPYQGTLVNSQGNPVDGLFNITFSIYPEPEGGTALWTEAHAGGNGVPVAQGLFNVNLGSLVPIPAEIWDQAPLFLGVQVGTDSEMLPRPPIGGVPVAMQASVAQLALTVPDRAITSAKAALTHGEIYGSGEVLTMTNTPQEIPSLSFTVNPTTPQVLQVSVTLDASAQNTNCPVVLARPYVDNVQVGPVMTLEGSVRTTISTTRQVNLSAGSHSVTFKAWCESGSGNIIMTGQSSVAYLLFSQ